MDDFHRQPHEIKARRAGLRLRYVALGVLIAVAWPLIEGTGHYLHRHATGLAAWIDLHNGD